MTLLHGATCSSVPEEVKLPAPHPLGEAVRPTGQPAAPTAATLDVQHDVYFTTRVVGPASPIASPNHCLKLHS